ncbi:branched-chain amino acid transport system II carrier protein [Parapusillimonas sp. SGNA-6]|nr:branched-chain amino acid transport system II carrier protein [Parapusillimonas sp. SGNA-6]
MQQTLKLVDLIALGFMTFALFLGAGNIIFPPMVGSLAGDQLWLAALGFLLTGVGLPLLTVVALARVGGGMDALTAPIGRVAGTVLSVIVYIAIGPAFATPRTATVSFGVGFAPFVGNGALPLFVYSVIYFSLVMVISLFPGRLIDNVGKTITPALIIALCLLGGAAVLLPVGSSTAGSDLYREAALSEGFLQGYQTMDALGALVFGIVIINAIRDRGVTDHRLTTRYAITAALIAATGLALVYVSLIYLGATSGSLAPSAETGVPILTEFVHYAFGPAGNVLLAIVITLACLTTAIGLITACGEYFSALLPVSYRSVVIVFSLFSMAVSNQGLTQLIAVAVPVLVGIYPVAIALVALGLLAGRWKSPSRVFIPTMLVAAVLGILDGLNAAGMSSLVPEWTRALPGATFGLGWLVPVAATMAAAAIVDRLVSRR